MTRDQDIEQRATRIINLVQDLDPSERPDRLRSLCENDPILYARIQARLGLTGTTPRLHDMDSELQDVDPSLHIAEGTQIGVYTIVRLLGSGGFGKVYLAEQTEPIRRQVALKIVKLGMDTEEIVCRFEVERQALAMMSHPGVARVFDAGVTERGRPYFVMEYVPGVSIGQFCDRNRLTTHERIKLFIDVCKVIEHAHQKGIIHRDLKPSNILVTMVDGRPQPKVIDFGIAKVVYEQLSDHPQLTRAGQAMGTPEYMSPEQASSDKQHVDTRTDVYSLGMVLYELLTGSLPHTLATDHRPSLHELREWVSRGETIRPSTRVGMLGEQALKISEARNTTPSGLARDLRGETEWIVLKALNREPGERYGSVHALTEDLQRLIRNEPVHAGPPTATYRARKFIRRHRGGVLATIAMASALIIGTTVATTGYISAQRAAVKAKQAEQRTGVALAQTQEQKEKAEQEATRAREVTDYLVRILTSVDPSVAGPTVRMIDVLQMAQVDLEHESFTDPVSNATIHGALGESYQAIGEYDQAHDHLKFREQAFADLFGPDDIRTLRARVAVGANLRALGRYEESRAILEPLVARLESTVGPDDPDTIGSLAHLGRLELETGNLPEAESIFREALDRSQRAQLTQQEIATAQADLGWAFLEQHKLAQAEQEFRQAEAILTASAGPTHPTTLRTRDTLAITLQNLGRVDEAIKMYEDILAIRREQMGEENPLTLWAMNNLATALTGMPGRTEQAHDLLVKVLDLQRKRFGNEHLFTITTMNNLASTCKRLGQLDQADLLWKEVVQHGTTLWGKEHPRTLAAMANRAALLSDMQRYDESRELFETALAGLEKSVGRHHGMWLAAKNGLGVMLINTGDFQAGLDCFEELIPEAKAALPPDHWYIFQFQSWRGVALIGLGQREQAAPILEGAIVGLSNQLGKNHVRVQGVRQRLIELYESLDRLEDARRIAEDYPAP